MNSLRMCISCREMMPKEKLIRIVKIKGEEPKIDISFKAQGRGAYICKNETCIENARPQRTFPLWAGVLNDAVMWDNYLLTVT